MMVRDAERDPIAVGVKVTLIVQLDPDLTALPQVSLSLKSPAFAPPTAIAEIVKGAVPGLLRVIACGGLVLFRVWLVNVRLLTDRLADTVPTVPLSPISCGPLNALVEI